MKHLKKIAAVLLAVLIITGLCACKTVEHIIAEEIISQNETVSAPDETNIETDENTEAENTVEPQSEEAELPINESENGELQNSEEDLTESSIGETSETEETEATEQSSSNSPQETETVEETAPAEENETQEEQTENSSVIAEQETKEEEKEDISVTEEPEETETGMAVGDGNFTITTSDGNVTKNGDVYTISAAGTYTLTGTLSDGQIIINAGDDDEVELELNGADISCSTDSPIYAVNADKVKIKAAEGTVNSVTDARNYVQGENDTAGSAAIYALCDLNIVGKGTLNVTAKTYNNGIHTKDDLKIKNVTLIVTAPNNAVKGNDSVTVESGNITLVSTGGDAIKTENSDISTKGNQRGTVTVSGGTLRLTAYDDGIDAAYDIVITDGEITVVNAGGKGLVANNTVNIGGGSVNVIKSADDAIHANSDNALENGETPNGDVTVSGGTIAIEYTGDDGIHADGTLLFTGGTVNIDYSREGLEGHFITFEDGNIHVYATDDAINATSTSNWGSDGLVTVSGGYIVAEVSGRDVDGIDSNGSYVQTGGFVLVSNPNSDSAGMMSAMDVDNEISVTGGILVALGAVPGGQGGGFGGGGFGGGFGGGGFGGPGGFGGGGDGGFGGPGGGFGNAGLPDGYVVYSGTVSAGTHGFTYNGNTYTFTLKNAVSYGWIWAEGISETNYTIG